MCLGFSPAAPSLSDPPTVEGTFTANRTHTRAKSVRIFVSMSPNRDPETGSSLPPEGRLFLVHRAPNVRVPNLRAPALRFMSDDREKRGRASARRLNDCVVGVHPLSVSWWKEAVQYDPLVVGAIAVALIMGNSALLDLPLSVPLLFAGWGGATLIYGLDRWPRLSPEDRWAHPRRVAWIRRHARWLWVERTVCIAVVVGSAFVLRSETVAVAFGFAALGILHVAPVWPGRRRLKSFGWGRRVSVAIVWATASVLLPLLEAQPVLDQRSEPAATAGSGSGDHSPLILALGLTVVRYLVVWANVAIIDWADGPAERRAGIKTFAGVGASAIRGRAVTAALAAAAGIVGLGVFTGRSPVLFGIEAVGAVGMAGLLWVLRPQDRGEHRLILDAAVAWPLLTFIVARTWGL